MKKQGDWDVTDDGRLLVHPMTSAEAGLLGQAVMMRIAWGKGSPTIPELQSSGQIQLHMDRYSAHALGVELVRLSGLSAGPYPKGRA